MRNNIKFIFASFTLLFFAACTESPTTPELSELNQHIETESANDSHLPSALGEDDLIRNNSELAEALAAFSMSHLEQEGRNYRVAQGGGLNQVICTTLYSGRPTGGNLCIYQTTAESFPLTGIGVEQIYFDLIDCMDVPSFTCPGGSLGTYYDFGFYDTNTDYNYVTIDLVTVECCY